MRSTLTWFAMALMGCAAAPPSAVAPDGPSLRLGAHSSAEGLTEVHVARDPGRLFIRSAPPHLSAYGAFVVAPPHLEFQGDIPEWPMRHRLALARDLSDMVRKKLVALRGWDVVTQAGGDVLIARVQVSNIGRQIEPPPGVNTTSRIVYVRNGGPIQVVIELLDSQTREPLLRFAQTRHLRAGTHSGSHIERERVEQAFHRVVDDLGEQLQFYALALELGTPP